MRAISYSQNRRTFLLRDFVRQRLPVGGLSQSAHGRCVPLFRLNDGQRRALILLKYFVFEVK